MKNIVFSLVFFFVSLIATAQNSYNSVSGTFGYGRAFNFNGWNDPSNRFISVIEVDRFFKSGFKVSAGVGYGYATYKIEHNATDVFGNPLGVMTIKSIAKSYHLPLTVGYDLIPGDKPLQLFIFCGYSFNTYFFERNKIYENSSPKPTITSVNRDKFYYRQVSTGIDARYMIKNKFYSGLSFTINDPYSENFYKVFDRPTYSIGVKFGVLF